MSILTPQTERQVIYLNIVDFIKSNNDYFQDVITRLTYHSNSIEGNTLSYAETYAILWNDNTFQVKAEPREFYEAVNHKYALSFILDSVANGEDLSEKLIKKVGIMINKNIKEIDGYRKVPVYIKGAEHIPPAPAMLNQTMMYFVYNYNHTEYNSLFEKAAVNHIAFERTHPFEDGNGRTGRLLINFEMLKNNLPPIVIPKEKRSAYFEMLAAEDSLALSEFFKELCEQEKERIEKFKISDGKDE